MVKALVYKVSLGLVMVNQGLFEEGWKPKECWHVVFREQLCPTGWKVQLRVGGMGAVLMEVTDNSTHVSGRKTE